MTGPSFFAIPAQEEAIAAPLAPVLLVAGAGTGKTTVMARRILHLVEQGLVQPDQVLALTFTNKAAANLKEKVRQALGSDADVTVATYHSFGASLVGDHALELDLHPSTQVLDKAQAWQLLFSVFDEFRFQRRRTFYPELLLDDALALASRCADHLVPIDAVIADCEEIRHSGRWKPMREKAEARLELCQVVATYERRKRERNLIDFGDQVALAVRLLTEHPEVADACRQQYPVVLLDEYQDTNFAQRRLLQLVYPSGGEGGRGVHGITAVGDDMQSIYGFRGAHLANILRFTEHFPPVQVRPLDTTLRFGDRLVTLANRIQSQVAEALDKELTAHGTAPTTSIECFLAADDSDEAATIADDIVASTGARASWADHAVLCRKRRLIRPILDALEDRKVPFEVVGASGLLDRPEIVDLVSWMEVVADTSASVALLRILEGPRYRIGLRDLAAVARHARALKDTDRPSALADALGDLENVADLSDAARTRLVEFVRERSDLAVAARRMPVLDLAETVIVRTGLWQAAGERGRHNLLRFLDLAQRFAPVDGDPGLPAFVEYLQLLDQSEEDVAESHPTDLDAVKVMTIHQAKGLEFPVVFVPGLAGTKGASRLFPDNRGGENALTNAAALPWWLREDDGIPSWRTATQVEIEEVIRNRKRDEEWRLLYVACTRAQRRLVCSAAEWYRGASEPQGPSVFYDFVAGQTELVTERFRRPPAENDPEVAAARARQHRRRDRYPAEVPSPPTQLQLDGAPAAVAPPALRPPPSAVSVTGLVTYARCPKQFFWSVIRPLPRRSSAASRIGTEVHRWIEQRAGRQLSLIDLDSGATDDTTDPSDHPPAHSGRVAGFKASFLESPLASLDPERVEAPFALALGRHLVRGRIDAVYERDGRLELVDFKTGRSAHPDDAARGLQLDVYGVAAVDTWHADALRLRTTYCHLRSDGPAILLSTDWDVALLEQARARLSQTLDALAEAHYQPTPGPWCGGCDFLSVCPAGQAQTT